MKSPDHKSQSSQYKKILESFNKFYEIMDDRYDNKPKRRNCWQYMNCPPDVQKECDALIKKAGRRCWLVAGSLSGNTKQCLFNQRGIHCKSCNFYIKVKKGEI